MFHVDDFEESPKKYIRDSLVYLEFYDSSKISLLEINMIVVECVSKDGHYKLEHRVYGTINFFELEGTIVDLMNMHALILIPKMYMSKSFPLKLLH